MKNERKEDGRKWKTKEKGIREAEERKENFDIIRLNPEEKWR